MSFENGKCPNCGSQIQIDSSQSFCFCSYCGSKISRMEAAANFKIEVSGKVGVDGILNIEQLRANAKKSYDVGQYDIAIGDLQKILNIDATDYKSYWGIVLCWMKQRPEHLIAEGSNNLNYSDYGLYKKALAYAPPNVAKQYEKVIADFNGAIISKRDAEALVESKKAQRSCLIYLIVAIVIIALIVWWCFKY
jgi:tetratricopeptide (TPR) repeat protein